MIGYPLELKLFRLHIEYVSFTRNQTEHHLEADNIKYKNYYSSARRHLLVSLGFFLLNLI